MTTYPFSFDQAEAISKDFQHLIGKKFNDDKGDNSKTECIAVAPHDGANKQLFLNEYTDCANATFALKVYDCELFDVIVIADNRSADGQLVYKDLLEYLEDNKIPIDLNDYTGQTHGSLS